LDDDQGPVLVHDHAGQLVGLAEAKAAGIVAGVEERFAPGNGLPQPEGEQAEPCSLIESRARNQPQSNLRRRAIKRSAQQQPTAVGYRQQRGRVRQVSFGQRDRLDLRGVHPNLASAQAVGGAAIDQGSAAGCPRVGRGRILLPVRPRLVLARFARLCHKLPLRSLN
jgi:hypothetical protein